MTRVPADLDLGEPAGVTLDLDGTLVDYRRSPGELLAVAGDRVGVDPPFPVAAYYDRFEEFADRTGSMRELRRECFAALTAERGGDPETGRVLAEAFAAERDHSNVDWVPGAAALVDRLDDRGVPYAVVTNGPPDAQRQKLAAVRLDERVAAVVFAGHDCPAKPDPTPIRRGLSELGVAPARAVHVGDSETDREAARRADVRAVIVE